MKLKVLLLLFCMIIISGCSTDNFNESCLKGLSRTSVGFELKSGGKAVITIMDADGAVVVVLINENARPGYNSLKWNSENVPSGRYMVTIEHNGSVSGRNVVLK